MKTNKPFEGVRAARSAGFVTAVLAAFLCFHPLSASTTDAITDRELVKNAELIFQGVVLRIDNRMSRFRTPSEAAVPHVFVTFQVERILKGTHTGQSNRFTLRLLGGPDKTARRFMRIEGCPDFDIGERVVLFVRRNERSVCPIVGWSQGRFRVIDGNIFSETGREVWLSPAGALVPGPERDLREALIHYRGGKMFAYRVHGGGVSSAAAAAPAGSRLSAAGFLNLISRMVSVLHTATELSRLTSVKSALPDEPFYFTQPRAVGEGAAVR